MKQSIIDSLNRSKKVKNIKEPTNPKKAKRKASEDRYDKKEY